MKKFIYTSETPCHTTIKVGKVETEISFYKNGVYELQGNNVFVKSMIAQGHMTIFKPLKTK